MTGPLDVCRLEYLTGTLATAYKGLVTSLVLKDFCMTETDGSMTVKGTVLSMPEGRYRASLIHEGIELSRAEIQNGFFELSAAADDIRKARNLQIDILQNGRHIGTFLLKREKAGEFFTSALELSEEMKKVNLSLLTAAIKDKPGLLKDAEDIVSHLAAKERDWKKLSEEINSFSKDIFWIDRDAHSRCYDILVTFSRRAAENVDAALSAKAAANFISLIALPLEHETDQKRLSARVEEWLGALQGSSIDLRSSFRKVSKVILDILERFPAMDILPLLKLLMVSAKKKIEGLPVIKDAALNDIEAYMPRDGLTSLNRYRESARNNLLKDVAAAEDLLDKRGQRAATEILSRLAVQGLDDADPADVVMRALGASLTKDSGESLLHALMEYVSALDLHASGAMATVASNMAMVMEKLAGLGMADSCEALLAGIRNGPPALKEHIVLEPRVASAILAAGNDTLIGLYSDILREVLIPAPRVTGFSRDTWAELANPLHLRRLSEFLSVMKLDSKRFTDVLVHVICCLSVSGVFVPDDKLFPREISAYLNSGAMRENFFLNYLLLRKLPVYYSEVAATGRVRDHTTEIDSWGNDIILYFMRKQTHVNASNYNVLLVEDIIRSWVFENPDILKARVPDDVLQKIDRGLMGQYSAAIRPLFEFLGILDGQGLHLERILLAREGDIRMRLKDIAASEEIRSKIALLCLIYQDIKRKYSLSAGNGEDDDAYEKLPRYVAQAGTLKETVLSRVKTEAQESLYFKRHIAFGIPSVMGSYHEPKFDALGTFLRTEERVRVILEGVISQIEHTQDIFSESDLRQWLRCVEAVRGLFVLHELGNFQVDEVAAILGTNTLRFSQIADLLRIWRKELMWMVNVCYRTFHDPLVLVLKRYPVDDFPESLKNLDPRGSGFIHKAADIIIRDLINGIVGFTELDRLIDALAGALKARVSSGRDEEIVPADKKGAPKDLYVIGKLPDDHVMRLAPFIGSKAKNLFYLSNKGLPVPAGAVFSAAHTADYKNYTGSEAFLSSLREAVRSIEDHTGLTFGDPCKPLFLSVRSGSYISMPGILSSILYCGMNESTLRGFIGRTGDPLLGWDSFRRFIEHYVRVVFGLDLPLFESASDRLADLATEKAGDLHADETEKIVRSYLAELKTKGLKIPEDPYTQLRESVTAVYGSWHGERALQFRRAMEVSPHWGTSVTLMEMVPGNQPGSGASVFFTRWPLSMENAVYGDTREGSTGDDLVSGRFVSRPLSRQQVVEGLRSLEETDAGLFEKHRELADRIEQAMGNLPQEAEVTYRGTPDGERLIYVLQTKRMEFHRGFTRGLQDVCSMEASIVGRGTGVNGGALRGVAAFSSSPEALRRLRLEQGLPVILLRKSASTDDVSLMPEVGGILTSTGGATSHAAILAQKFGLTAVVGCSDMRILDDHGTLSARIGEYAVTEGTSISMDGSTGLVYSGLCMLVAPPEGR